MNFTGGAGFSVARVDSPVIFGGFSGPSLTVFWEGDVRRQVAIGTLAGRRRYILL